MKKKSIDTLVNEIRQLLPATIRVSEFKHDNRVYMVYIAEVIPDAEAPTYEQKLLLHGLGAKGNFNLLSHSQAEAIITTAYRHNLRGRVMISI